jgi:CRISPR-associated protein Csd1
MILSALNSLYERTVGMEGGPPPLGYAEMPVVGALDISGAGELLQLQDLRRELSVGKKTRLLPARRVVPQPPKRTVAITAGFLCDNAGYLLGHTATGSVKRAADQFAAARALHEAVLARVNGPAAIAILEFFRRWDRANAAAYLADGAKEMASGWLVLRDGETGRFFHDLPAIRAAWERYSAIVDAPHGQCLVTGRDNQPIAVIHPAVKGVQGAQSSGAALVSFNLDAFASYGKSQNLNAPIGTAAAFAYTTALNHLLRPESRRKLRIGDATVVVWAERETPAERVIASILGAVSDEEGELSEENRARPVHDQLLRVAAGRWAEEPELAADEHVRFFVLALAPNAARLQLRFFYTATLGELLRNLQHHCRDILLQDPQSGVRVPTLWTLVRETLPKDKDGRTRSDDSAQKKLNKMHGDLARAVLTAADYPQSLLPVVLCRFRSDRRLTAARLGLLKGCINRHRRFAGGFQPEIAMGLDENNTECGYLLGRLFAQLENMQELSRGRREREEGTAAGRDQPTIRDRFMSAASVTPRSVFPHLLDLESAHERKAKRDRARIAHAAAHNLGAFINRIGDFPPQLDPHQQGLFFIGYHHQRQARFAGRAEEVARADENGSDQTPEE